MTHRANAFSYLDRDLRFISLGVEEPRVLTPEQIRRYNEAGHLFPIDIFSPAEIAEIRAYIDDLLPRALAAGWDNYQVVNWHKHCRGIWDIVTDSRIIDVVSDLLGDTVVLRHSHLFAKLPGDPKRVSWHQDASYWPLTPSREVSAWLAIDDIDIDNSAKQVIGGSHHHAQLTFRDSTAAENNVLFQTVDNAADYGDAPVALEMAGGSDLPAQRLDPARLGTQPVQPPPLRAGDALPLRGRARLQRLERQLHLVPRHRRRWPLGQPPPPPRRTRPHPPRRRRSRPRQRSIPQPPPPAVTHRPGSRPPRGQAGCWARPLDLPRDCHIPAVLC